MVILADHNGTDPLEWEHAGILHDLDYDETKKNREMHGILASKMLEGKVSNNILQAIRSHDHRTGVKPTSLLDHSLIFADAVAIIIDESNSVLDEKPWIKTIVEEYENLTGICYEKIVRITTC